MVVIPKTFNRCGRKEASNECKTISHCWWIEGWGVTNFTQVTFRDISLGSIHERFGLWMSNRWHLMSFSCWQDTFPARLIRDSGYTFSFALYSPECWLCTRRINKGGSLPEFQVRHELFHGHGVQEHKIRLSKFQALVLCHDETPSVGVARGEMILTSCFEVLTGGWALAGCSSVRSCSLGARCHSCVKSQSVNSVIFQQGRKAAEH